MIIDHCPFCKSTNCKVNTNEEYEHYVECECGARGPSYDFGNDELDFDEVITAWNTRNNEKETE
jgi:hypothetical protein